MVLYFSPCMYVEQESLANAKVSARSSACVKALVKKSIRQSTARKVEKYIHWVTTLSPVLYSFV